MLPPKGVFTLLGDEDVEGGYLGVEDGRRQEGKWVRGDMGGESLPVVFSRSAKSIMVVLCTGCRISYAALFL